MKKLLSLVLVVMLAVVALVSAAPAQATQNEVVKCGTEFLTEQPSKDGDSTYNHVNIDFIDNPFWVGDKTTWGHPDSVKIEAQEGYKIVKVELKIDSDDQEDYVDYTSSFPGTVNPNPGYDIKYAKVTVVKTCTEVCNDKTATNFEEVVEGTSVANNELCKFPVVEQPPVATPSATPTKAPELPNTGSEGLLFGLFGLVVSGVAGGVKFLVRNK